jgi:photosystem II stability/assembly factor-like uncharacterized protein
MLGPGHIDEFISMAAFAAEAPESRGNLTVSWSPATLILTGTRNGRLFRSEDSGATWQSVGAWKDPLWSIVGDAAARRIFLAAQRDGLLMSSDRGRNWVEVGGSVIKEQQPSSLAWVEEQQSRVYVGTTVGTVWSSADEGKTWTPVGSGLPKLPVMALAASRDTVGSLWAAVEGGGVFEFAAGAHSWAERSEGIADRNVVALAVDPEVPQRLFVAGTGGVYETRDCGRSWQSFVEGIGPITSINALAVSPDGRLLFAGENAKLLGRALR